jgi:hypothetical protein
MKSPGLPRDGRACWASGVCNVASRKDLERVSKRNPDKTIQIRVILGEIHTYETTDLSSICRTRSLRDPDPDSSTDQCRGAAMRYRRRRCYKHAPDRATQSDDRKRHIRSL